MQKKETFFRSKRERRSIKVVIIGGVATGPKTASPKTLTEKLVEEKLDMDAMDYFKP